MIRKGEPWGTPVTGPPDAQGTGDDTDLARLVGAHPGALLRFVPDEHCDLARAVGLTADSTIGTTAGTELTLDVLRVEDVTVAVNMVMLGTSPDALRWYHRMRHATVVVDGRTVHDGPATTVVVANGQFLRGADLVPRGHPGDARAEVQVYALRRTERAPMRKRLRTAAHLPHPDIKTTTGKIIEVTWTHPAPATYDSRSGSRTTDATIRVEPNAYRLVV